MFIKNGNVYMEKKDKFYTGCLVIPAVLLSFAALMSVLRGCRVITGNAAIDANRATNYLKETSEDGKALLHDGLKEVHRVVAPNIPVLGDVVQTATQVVKPMKPQLDTRSIPCGLFTVNLLSRSGDNKQFIFKVLGKEKDGKIRMSCAEYGTQSSNLGGNVQFNVVFWDQNKDSQKGISFSLDFNRSKGVLIRPFNVYKQTVYVGRGEHVCAQLSEDNRRVLISDLMPNLNGCDVLDNSERLIGLKTMSVSSKIRKIHEAAGVPLEVKEVIRLKKNRGRGAREE